MSPLELLRQNLRSSAKAKLAFAEMAQPLDIFNEAVLMLLERYRLGGRLYIAGNGGSAADAQHLAAEFVSKLARDRAPLPAEALTTDSSTLTAIGNDYGFEQVFARQILGKATQKDAFLAITTSGNSPNILRALEACREVGIPSIVFSGRDGGKSLVLCDYCIIAPGATTATIQELHIVLAHSLCESIERAIFERIAT